MAHPPYYPPPRSPMELLGRMEQQISALQHQMTLIRQQWNLPPSFMEPRPSSMAYLPHQVMNTAVPLQSAPPPSSRSRFPHHRVKPIPQERPEIYSLSDILDEGEAVTMRIRVGSTEATALLYWNGHHLVVRECYEVTSLVGQASEKAGTLLYAFMEGLVEAGLLPRTFRVAPWKLCFVRRNGTDISLNLLRKKTA